MVTDRANSGPRWPGEGWLKPFRDPDDKSDQIQQNFLKGVIDLRKKARRRDSEIKYIFHFLANYVDEADEFLITTQNIFKTCSSCQGELLMLKDYVENILGKKMSLKVIAPDFIKDGKDFYNKIISQ